MKNIKIDTTISITVIVVVMFAVVLAWGINTAKASANLTNKALRCCAGGCK